MLYVVSVYGQASQLVSGVRSQAVIVCEGELCLAGVTLTETDLR